MEDKEIDRPDILTALERYDEGDEHVTVPDLVDICEDYETDNPVIADAVTAFRKAQESQINERDIIAAEDAFLEILRDQILFDGEPEDPEPLPFIPSAKPRPSTQPTLFPL